MENIFLLLSLACFVALIIGIIKPQIVVRWGNKEKINRKNVLKYYGIGLVLSFILFGITHDNIGKKQEKNSVSTSTVASNEKALATEEKAKAEAEQKAKAEAEQKAKAEAEQKAYAEAEQKAKAEAKQKAYAGMGISRKEVQDLLRNLNYDFNYVDKSQENAVPLVSGKLNDYPIVVALKGYPENLELVSIFYGIDGSYIANPSGDGDASIKKCFRVERDLIENIFKDKKLGIKAAAWSATTFSNVSKNNFGPFDKVFGDCHISCAFCIKDNTIMKAIVISSTKDLE